MEDGLYLKDRAEAGRLLAKKLADFKNADNTVILALPRGGAAVAQEVAKVLNLPLDLVVVRKIGHPLNPEFAIGAITDNGHLVGIEGDLVDIDPEWLKVEIDRQLKEAKRRKELYLNGKTIDISGKTVILVDDGIATGMSMLAAIKEVEDKGARKIVMAVPIVPKDAIEMFSASVDEMRFVVTPQFFLGAIGAYYDQFPQVSDEEVIEIMKKYG